MTHLTTFALGIAGASLILKFFPVLTTIGLIGGLVVAGCAYAYSRYEAAHKAAGAA